MHVHRWDSCGSCGQIPLAVFIVVHAPRTVIFMGRYEGQRSFKQTFSYLIVDADIRNGDDDDDDDDDDTGHSRSDSDSMGQGDFWSRCRIVVVSGAGGLVLLALATAALLVLFCCCGDKKTTRNPKKVNVKV